MAGSWLRGVVGVSLTLCVAGQALAAEGKVTVFAAASLTNAMQDIAQAYKKEKNVEVVSSFASSSTLARQIEAGAPADLFISADQKWMDYAADKKAIVPATRATLLGNSLVVVAPKASAQGAITIDEKTDWTSLLKGGRLAVGAIHSMSRPVSMPKKHCRNSVPGRRCRRSSPRLKTCAVRWRWWSATKRRWGLSMAPMPWPARG